MATPYVASLRREDEEKESRAYNRGKRGSVSFQPQLSFYSASANGTDFEGHYYSHSKTYQKLLVDLERD